MAIWCRLCREPVVDGSQFCLRHRAQAALFSRAFAPGEDPTTSSSSALTPAETPPPHALTEAERAADLLAQTVGDMIGLGGFRKPGRWPKISLYYAGDDLLARTYFAVVPAEVMAAQATTPLLDDAEIKRGLALGGPIRAAVVAHFDAVEGALRTQALESLDVHLVRYAGLVAINSHRAGGHDANLVTLIQTDAGFQPASLEEARPRLRHQRW